jgi:hypothetical protein
MFVTNHMGFWCSFVKLITGVKLKQKREINTECGVCREVKRAGEEGHRTWMVTVVRRKVAAVAMQNGPASAVSSQCQVRDICEERNTILNGKFTQSVEVVEI